MTRYVWREINHEPGYGDPFDVDGTIVPGTVKNADPLSTRFAALVRLPDEDSPSGLIEVTDDSETDEEGATCGVNGCSRQVENPEDTCWQHD